MLFLIALILASGMAYACRKPLKQHPYLFYAAAILCTAAIPSLSFENLSPWVSDYVLGLFSRGALATALWCVVMWTGAFPNGSKPMKALMPVRGELSILAAFLTLGHNRTYGKTYFPRLFAATGRMTAGQTVAGILSLAMLVIMIPLTVMSFPAVRRRMNPRLWKKIQRTAYLFYALLYLHVMILFLPLARTGKEGYFLSILIYSIVFIGYAVCRIRKQYLLRRKTRKLTALNAVCLTAFAVLLLLPCSLAKSGGAAGSVREKTESASETSADDLPEASAADFSEASSKETSETMPADGTDHVSVYNDGTYTATAFGYDGDIEVVVTIKNDRITAITGSTDESDSWYYDSASGSVISQILEKQTARVDAYAGATYSSEGIMEAVQKALDQAKKEKQENK